LPFLPLFEGVSHVVSSQTLDSSRFAGIANVTFRAMGGKSGKIVARNGKDVATDGTVSGKNGNVWRGGVASTSANTSLPTGVDGRYDAVCGWSRC
jgi:hypothetical protein